MCRIRRWVQWSSLLSRKAHTLVSEQTFPTFSWQFCESLIMYPAPVWIFFWRALFVIVILQTFRLVVPILHEFIIDSFYLPIIITSLALFKGSNKSVKCVITYIRVIFLTFFLLLVINLFPHSSDPFFLFVFTKRTSPK